MARPPRIDIEHGWYHVMNRGADHGSIFFADSDRIEFGARLADIHDRFGVEIHAYCLLDNHYHLLLHCPRGGLSDAMQRLGSLYTRHVNDRLGRDGAIFRGRFASRLIADDRYLLTAVRYIHRNALDVGGVEGCDEYRWSSHRAYLGFRRCPVWLSTSVVMSHFPDRLAFAEFVEHPTVRAVRVDRPSIGVVVDAATFVAAEMGLGQTGAAGALARSAALAWALGDEDVPVTMLSEWFGLASPAAARMARSRARRRLVDDPSFRELVRRSTALAAA